jgi:hypothetical protein
MSTFTIAAVSSETRDWKSSQGAENRSYYVKQDGDEKVYELAQKRDKAPPKVGDTIDATIETREHNGTTYYKLKRIYNQQGGGRGGGGNSPKSPEERASIERQTAAKVAAELLIAMIEKGNWTPASDALLEEHARYAKRIAEGIAG